MWSNRVSLKAPEKRWERGIEVSQQIYRIFTEKKKGYDLEAQGLLQEMKNILGVSGLKQVRVINRYDLEGISQEVYEKARSLIFCEPPLELVYDEELTMEADWLVLAMEYLPGQYDQRADSAVQCLRVLDPDLFPVVKTAKLLLLSGAITDGEFHKSFRTKRSRVEETMLAPTSSRDFH